MANLILINRADMVKLTTINKENMTIYTLINMAKVSNLTSLKGPLTNRPGKISIRI